MTPIEPKNRPPSPPTLAVATARRLALPGYLHFVSVDVAHVPCNSSGLLLLPRSNQTKVGSTLEPPLLALLQCSRSSTGSCRPLIVLGSHLTSHVGGVGGGAPLPTGPAEALYTSVGFIQHVFMKPAHSLIFNLRHPGPPPEAGLIFK